MTLTSKWDNDNVNVLNTELKFFLKNLPTFLFYGTKSNTEEIYEIIACCHVDKPHTIVALLLHERFLVVDNWSSMETLNSVLLD